MTLRRSKAFDFGKLINALDLDENDNLIVDEDPTSDNGVVRKSYLDDQLGGVVDAAPTALDTLNELAAALGDDANFATTVSANIGAKLDSDDYNAADILSKLSTAGGAGSGLDADSVDGIEASALVKTADIDVTVSGIDHEHIQTHSSYVAVTDDSVTTYNFTYNPNNVSVYLNRLILRPAEYTASNGTSITILISLQVNDEIEIVSVS